MDVSDDLGYLVPELENEPELLPENVFYWTSFLQLIGSRNSGYGVGPIPVSEMVAYMAAFPTWFGAEEERRVFIRLMQAMDRVYLDHCSKRMPGGGTSRS